MKIKATTKKAIISVAWEENSMVEAAGIEPADMALCEVFNSLNFKVIRRCRLTLILALA